MSSVMLFVFLALTTRIFASFWKGLFGLMGSVDEVPSSVLQVSLD